MEIIEILMKLLIMSNTYIFKINIYKVFRHDKFILQRQKLKNTFKNTLIAVASLVQD